MRGGAVGARHAQPPSPLPPHTMMPRRPPLSSPPIAYHDAAEAQLRERPVRVVRNDELREHGHVDARVGLACRGSRAGAACNAEIVSHASDSQSVSARASRAPGRHSRHCPSWPARPPLRAPVIHRSFGRRSGKPRNHARSAARLSAAVPVSLCRHASSAASSL